MASIFSGVNNPGIDFEQFTQLEVEVLEEIAGLTPPGADRILFWDDSASSYAYLAPGSGLSIIGTTITATATGDVAGPVASTDNAIARFDGTTGKVIQNSVLIIDDTTGNITGPAAGFKIIGGTGTTADLSFQTTSGVGVTGADMHFLVGNNGATEAMVIMNGGFIGMGTAAPNSNLEVASQNNNFPFWVTAYNSAGTPFPGFVGRGARGTMASPAQLNANDTLFAIAGRGYHSGNAFSGNSTGFIAIRAAEGFTSTAQGTYMDFATTPNGSTARAVAMTILGNGNVGIGVTSPNTNAILDVSSTTKAFMPPRMTTTQKNAIASPTAGMIVYDTTLSKLSVYTTVWETVTSL